MQARLICLLLNSKGSIFRSAKSLENLFAKNEIQALKTVDIFLDLFPLCVLKVILKQMKVIRKEIMYLFNLLNRKKIKIFN